MSSVFNLQNYNYFPKWQNLFATVRPAAEIVGGAGVGEIAYLCTLENTKVMADIFGYSETLYACNTYQFNDYSRYDFNLFSEEDKRRYRDEHFATDLQNARDLGRRLVEMAKN